MTPRQLSERVIAEAARLGIHRVGITGVAPPARYPAYRAWVDAGRHGTMDYMAADNHVRGRADLGQMLPSARSVIVCGLAYASDPTPAAEGRGPHGFVARYARGDDYHRVLHQKLAALGDALEAAAGRQLERRSCVDSAPVLERELAERAGLGFVGKNTMLITPGLGSYLVLGELLVDLELEPTEPERITSRCGSCTACLDACPTDAFPAAYELDARRCISYLTIEHTGPIDPALRPALGTMIFGCDICQQVCPFNAAAPERTEPAAELRPRSPGRGAPDLLGILALGANQRRRFVEASAMRRVNREQLLRNSCVALGNRGDPAAIEPLSGLLGDRSPLVRRHAAWALGQLGAAEPCRARLDREDDPEVVAELRAAIAAAES